MYFSNEAADYKGKRFWYEQSIGSGGFLLTDDPELAKRFHFRERLENCPNIFRKRVYGWQVKASYTVQRQVTYVGKRLYVFHYDCESNKYYLTTDNEGIAKELGFERYDQGTFHKAVPVAETSDAQDEYVLLHKRWF